MVGLELVVAVAGVAAQRDIGSLGQTLSD